MTQYQTLTGETVRLGTKLKSGGEGTVWTVTMKRRLLAKTYHKGVSAATEAKLKAMLALAPKDPNAGHISIAWPTDILYDGATCVGFLMPYMRKEATTIFNFQHPQARRKRFPKFNRRQSYHMGVNLSSAVELIHYVGHVIGDLNEANILARPNGLITLIDTDSFQVDDRNGNVYRCTVGMDNLMAPEIQNLRRGEFDWNETHDRFALAIHLFGLLVGSHPFNGVLKDGQSVNSIDTHLIQLGAYPYLPNPIAAPPPGTEKLYRRLPPAIRDAFERTFGEGHKDPSRRVSASDWKLLFTHGMTSLRRCRKCRAFNEHHLQECSLCARPIPVRIGGQHASDNWRQQLADWYWEYYPTILPVAAALVLLGFLALFFLPRHSGVAVIHDQDSTRVPWPPPTPPPPTPPPVTPPRKVSDKDRLAIGKAAKDLFADSPIVADPRAALDDAIRQHMSDMLTLFQTSNRYLTKGIDATDTAVRREFAEKAFRISHRGLKAFREELSHNEISQEIDKVCASDAASYQPRFAEIMRTYLDDDDSSALRKAHASFDETKPQMLFSPPSPQP